MLVIGWGEIFKKYMMSPPIFCELYCRCDIIVKIYKSVRENPQLG